MRIMITDEQWEEMADAFSNALTDFTLGPEYRPTKRENGIVRQSTIYALKVALDTVDLEYEDTEISELKAEIDRLRSEWWEVVAIMLSSRPGNEFIPQSIPQLAHIRETYARAEAEKLGHTSFDTELKEFDMAIGQLVHDVRKP